MKVIIISNSYPDNADSYRGIFIQKLAAELIQSGHSVIIVTPRTFQNSPAYEVNQGAKVFRFPYPSGNKPLGQSGRIPLLPMAVYMISGLLRSLILIRKECPDVIHGNWIVPTGLIAALAGRIMSVPVVNSAHGMDVRIGRKWPVSLLFDIAIQLSTTVTVVSETMRARRGLGQAAVVPFGVEERFFSLRRENVENRIISTRSLEPLYDLETIIKALPRILHTIPDARLTLIGSGSQEKLLQQHAHELGVGEAIDFIGHVSNAQIPSYMSHAKVYVSTSLTDGTSISLLEGIAAGLIPVVSDIPANRPWITPGDNGYLFRARDSEDLARKIIQALKHEEKFASVLEKRRITLKDEVSWRSIAGRFATVYHEAVELARQKRG